jgi:hypothetical protein
MNRPDKKVRFRIADGRKPDAQRLRAASGCRQRSLPDPRIVIAAKKRNGEDV